MYRTDTSKMDQTELPTTLIVQNSKSFCKNTHRLGSSNNKILRFPCKKQTIVYLIWHCMVPDCNTMYIPLRKLLYMHLRSISIKISFRQKNEQGGCTLNNFSECHSQCRFKRPQCSAKMVLRGKWNLLWSLLCILFKAQVYLLKVPSRQKISEVAPHRKRKWEHRLIFS